MAPTVDFVNEAIKLAVRTRTAEIVQEEVEKAAAEVRRRVAKEVDKIALTLLSEYDVRSQRDSVVITVKKVV